MRIERPAWSWQIQANCISMIWLKTKSHVHALCHKMQRLQSIVHTSMLISQWSYVRTWLEFIVTNVARLSITQTSYFNSIVGEYWGLLLPRHRWKVSIMTSCSTLLVCNRPSIRSVQSFQSLTNIAIRFTSSVLCQSNLFAFDAFSIPFVRPFRKHLWSWVSLYYLFTPW